MLNKTNRLTNQKDFDNIAKHGNPINTPYFVIKTTTNLLSSSRFGIIISTRIDKKAVTRNKLRRQLSEVLRTNLSSIKAGYDIVFFTKKNILNIDYKTLEKEVIKGLKRGKCLATPKKG